MKKKRWNQVKKKCVFCGIETFNKTKEHIIPQWLIGLTGNTNRVARFGPFIENGKLTHKLFYFNSFKFPSCHKCNSVWSSLESQAKRVMVNLLSNNSLNGRDFNYILTWFDKVRIGLWIAAIYMIKNFFGIQPHFYINSGTYTKDRMLLIYKNNTKITKIQRTIQ